jgi:hypothetical protein
MRTFLLVLGIAVGLLILVGVIYYVVAVYAAVSALS